jgi:hypothetical protein
MPAYSGLQSKTALLVCPIRGHGIHVVNHLGSGHVTTSRRIICHKDNLLYDAILQDNLSGMA